eukprot:808204-Rhodomonas_salina.2
MVVAVSVRGDALELVQVSGLFASRPEEEEQKQQQQQQQQKKGGETAEAAACRCSSRCGSQVRDQTAGFRFRVEELRLRCSGSELRWLHSRCRAAWTRQLGRVRSSVQRPQFAASTVSRPRVRLVDTHAATATFTPPNSHQRARLTGAAGGRARTR